LDSIGAFFQGLQIIANPVVLLVIVIGTLISVVLGILPGINASFAMIVALPFILGMDPQIVLPLMITFTSVGATSGAVTAVLTGIPGDTPNAATVLDGFPMTRKGQGSRGVGAAIASSTFGCVATVIMAFLMMPLVIPMVMAFKSPEMFLLIVVGLCFLAVVTKGSRIKGLISATLGILLSTIGYQVKTGIPRFTFGSLYIYDGIDIVVLVMGLFAMPILLEMATEEQSIAPPGSASAGGYRQMFQGVRDVFHSWWLWLKCTIIGYIVGIIPGIGGETAMWVSYAQAKKSTRHPEELGTGNVDGVIAPQAAVTSKTAGDLLTTLAFGIPGSTVMVFLLTAMILVGIQPGPKMVTEQTALSFSLLQTVALSSILGGLICFLFAPYLVKLTKISTVMLFCTVTPLVLISVYSKNFASPDMLMLVFMTAVGIFLNKFGYSKAALMLGFILGQLFETYIWFSLDLQGPLFFVSSPVSIFLLLVIVGLLGQDVWKMAYKRFLKPMFNTRTKRA
jgi:putative tricarboxylic transport membrane protein